jgi:hypothetical protein
MSNYVCTNYLLQTRKLIVDPSTKLVSPHGKCEPKELDREAPIGSLGQDRGHFLRISKGYRSGNRTSNQHRNDEYFDAFLLVSHWSISCNCMDDFQKGMY